LRLAAAETSRAATDYGAERLNPIDRVCERASKTPLHGEVSDARMSPRKSAFRSGNMPLKWALPARPRIEHLGLHVTVGLH
jgi:hypothetical protein